MVVADYGDWLAEYKSLRESAGILDFSFRGRLCLTGNDRIRFLHGDARAERSFDPSYRPVFG